MLTAYRFRVKTQSVKFDKLQGRKRITSKEGTYDFFPTVAKYCPRSTKYVRWWNLWRRVSGQLTPPKGGTIRQNSIGHNWGPEVDIDKRSTAFFTGRRPLTNVIKSFRQGAPQVGDLEKVPRPQIFKPQFLKNWSSKAYQTLHVFRGPCPPSIKEVSGNSVYQKKLAIPKSDFWGLGAWPPNGGKMSRFIPQNF